MIELRTHVEKIVRPIVASPRRKDRMREELLEHLSLAFSEHGNAAFDRLGPPDLVRQELQTSVPRLERLMFYEGASRHAARFCHRDGESAFAFAATRSLLLVALMIATAFVVTMMVSAVELTPWPSWPRTLRQLGVFSALGTATFGSLWLLAATGGTRVVSVRSGSGATLKTTIVFGFTTLYLGLFFGQLAFFSGAAFSQVTGFLSTIQTNLLVASLLLPVLFIWVSKDYAARQKRWQDWGSLDL